MVASFRPGRGARRELRRLLAGGVAAARVELEQARPSSAQVHDARRALKLVRALLRLARPGLGGRGRRVERLLRDAASLLAPARDACAAADALRRLGASADAPSLRQRAAARRVLAAESADPAPADVARARRLLARATQRLAALDHEGGWAALERGFVRMLARARGALELLAEGRDDEAHHALRKRVKDLAHHARAFFRVGPGELRAWARGLDRLGVLLGDERDLGLLAERLAAASGDHVAVLQAAARQRLDLRRRALVLARALLAQRPRELARALRHARARR